MQKMARISSVVALVNIIIINIGLITERLNEFKPH